MSLLDDLKGMPARYGERRLRLDKIIRDIRTKDGDEAANELERLALSEDTSRRALCELLNRHGYQLSITALDNWRRHRGGVTETDSRGQPIAKSKGGGKAKKG